jgi:hypothetical protein
VGSQSTALVLRRPATQAITRNDTAYPYPLDSYTWSVTAGNDGSYHFYAAPRTDSSNAFSQSYESQSGQASAPGWQAQQTRNAAAQYLYHASMPAQSSGQYVNVYA